MANQKNYQAFTIRIPENLASQIEARAQVNHRSRNSEVIALLERSIDASVSRDLQITAAAASGRK